MKGTVKTNGPTSSKLARHGRGGIRTLGLYSAIVALSQLSYAPGSGRYCSGQPSARQGWESGLLHTARWNIDCWQAPDINFCPGNAFVIFDGNRIDKPGLPQP